MERGPAFIDASGWVAIISADDRNHRAAKLAYQQIISQKTRIITTFKAKWTPTFVLLDAQGRIVLVHVGGGFLQNSDLQRFLQAL